jgi:hypothetical protein
MRTQLLKSSFGILILWAVSAIAQIDVDALLLGDYLEIESSDADEVWNTLAPYLENPLIWNNCSLSEIEDLPLHGALKQSLLKLKRRRRKFNDWGKLQEALPADDAELAALQFFFRLEEPPTIKGSLISYTAVRDHTESWQLDKNLLRNRWHFPNGLMLGAVIEQDNRELPVWDYWNWSLQWPELFGRLDLIAGAYRVRWGHGLLLADNYIAARSNAAARNMRKRPDRVTQYLGSDENRYLSGLALTVATGHWRWQGFYSYHRRDATVTDSVVTALRTDGLHQTESQLAAKDALAEHMLGGSVSFQRGIYQGGVLFIHSHYGLPLNLLELADRQTGLSLVQSIRTTALELSTELALLASRDWALFGSMIYSIEQPLQLSLGYRRYSENFKALQGYPYQQYSGLPENEAGVYLGLELGIRSWQVSAYADFFRRLQSPDKGTPVPGGTEVLLALERRFRGGHRLQAKYKRTADQIDRTSEPDRLKQQLQLTGRYSLLKTFDLDLRLVQLWLNTESGSFETGTGISFSSNWTLGERDRLISGSTHFYSPSFDSRIYLYEPGAPYRFNMTMLSGTGCRVFAVWKHRFVESFESALAIKYQVRREPGTADWQDSVSLEFELLVAL